MKIKILGSRGCATCTKLEKNVRKAVEELDFKAEVEKVEDYAKMMYYGIASTPALVVDEKVKFEGWVPSVEELKKILQAEA
jgi:small redox-active disulfide protein 2